MPHFPVLLFSLFHLKKQQNPVMLVLLVRIKLEKNSYSNLESKGSLFTFSVIFISNIEPANSNAREIKCMNNYIFCDLEKGDVFYITKRDAH